MKRIHILISSIARKSMLVVLSVGLFACGERSERSPDTAIGTNTVRVTAKGLTLDAPDEIASGWSTFVFANESSMTHFVLIERLPEGVGVADQQEEVAPVFQEGMDLLLGGDTDKAMAKFGELPEWFGQIAFLGGPGLVSPGRTADATVYLEPGTYLLECYVKTNGVFHSYNPNPSEYGMVREFRVTDSPSSAQEPSATLKVVLSSERGIEVTGVPTPVKHTVAVHFEDQAVHENFVGHDLHLVKLDADTDVDRLEEWMDWRRPGGLETPAPAVFVGGTNEMPAGSTTYFTAEFAPGQYAWIAEVPASREKGFLKVFTVEPGM